MLPTFLITTAACFKHWSVIGGNSGGLMVPSSSLVLYNYLQHCKHKNKQIYSLCSIVRLFGELNCFRLNSLVKWASHLIRWKQTNEIGYLPNEKMPDTFMGYTLDLFGKSGDMHEAGKQRMAKRLVPGHTKRIFK